MKTLLMVAALGIGIMQAQAAERRDAFGITEGQAWGSILTGGCNPDSPEICMLHAVPRSHPLLKHYAAIATQAAGACAVYGWADVPNADELPDRTFKTLIGQLTQAYGPPINGGENSARWERPFASIALLRIASANTTEIQLSYKFPNYEKCFRLPPVGSIQTDAPNPFME